MLNVSKAVVSFPIPVVAERTSGVKVECSISRTPVHKHASFLVHVSYNRLRDSCSC